MAILPSTIRTITVEAIEDPQTLATWSRVLCSAFGAPQTFGEAFAELVITMGLDAASPFRHFLGRVEGEPAATCSVFFGAGVAGIYDVATLPSAAVAASAPRSRVPRPPKRSPAAIAWPSCTRARPAPPCIARSASMTSA